MNQPERGMEVYALKVTLLGTSPPIWRRILVPREITLRDLHRTLQTVMGWSDSHLHQFRAGAKIAAEHRTKLGELIGRAGERLLYEYDLGDCWQHELLLEEILLGDDTFQQMCVAGKRSCPPEDCGGPPGFAELLQARQDANHPSHQEACEWLGDFVAESFSADELNRRLRRRKKQ